MPIGVFVGSSAVLIGGITGTLIGKKMPERILEQLLSFFGLSAIAIGITLIIKMENLTPVILAFIVGSIIGELIGIEQNLKKGIEKTVLKTRGSDTKKTEILITAIVLFCFGSTGIFGALIEGFTGDSSILFAKSVMDFFTAIIFGATAGFLVALIAIPQCLIMLLFFLSAGLIVPLLSPSMLNDFKACGGIITLAAGLKVANIKHMHVINMLPSLFIVVILSYIWLAIM